MVLWGVRNGRTSFEVNSVVDGSPGTWRQSALPVEFLPMLQPSTDALPHLIPTKAPTGTSYSSTRRGCAHKPKITQLASVRARTEPQFHLKPKSLCVFSTEAWETEPGVSKVPPCIAILSEPTCGWGHECLSPPHSSGLCHTKMTVCDAIPPCNLPLRHQHLLLFQLNIVQPQYGGRGLLLCFGLFSHASWWVWS